MNALVSIAKSELILGGQRSGKSRRAEQLARQWLDESSDNKALLIATAQPWDDEMRQRIARHQADRAERVPGMQTLEEPLALGAAIASLSRPHTLVVVDCLTLWLTNLLMPVSSNKRHDADSGLRNTGLADAPIQELLQSIEAASGPVILVGNEIGMGVIPLGAQVRAFVDTLGRLNQDVARVCSRVTLMVAGLPLSLKDSK